MSKQDRQGARTPADLERKYNFGKRFADFEKRISDLEAKNKELEAYIARNAEGGA